MATHYTRAELAKRVIRKADYTPCEEAFVDTRLPGREGKLNYCIIGAGVSENENQVVNLSEPHGFNLGGVSLPTGKINSLHSHTTAEVFLVVRGDWRFFWGHNGDDGEAVLSPGDVISIPTGTFRAFESVGSDDNFMISFLGEDDPGHVTWGNDVIEQAAAYGFYLAESGMLIDTTKGDSVPEGTPVLQSLTPEQLRSYNRTSQAEMEARVYNVERFPGRTDAFADCALAGGAKTYHAIIGEGAHEIDTWRAHILNPHSFSLGAIAADPGNGFLPHRAEVPVVLVVGAGSWQVTMGEPDDETSFEIDTEDTLSIPAGITRSIRCRGDQPGLIYLAYGGDQKVSITWSDAVREALDSAATGAPLKADS
ncbi:cupin domain-containing protein [Exilibacterium tricleocarpae]|uniref:Cupin domain-containing protein n=1 Tax=Exilibacterium tricleocarpae TaxID=2591008 RepID=A0A545TVF8_9GAMM|nr:cupin domain-containing protein [Exilibacterium tricleocarpae]TQV81194.1 cupin domain-containing protein [Exilibacterium tricleocarpae]